MGLREAKATSSAPRTTSRCLQLWLPVPVHRVGAAVRYLGVRKSKMQLLPNAVESARGSPANRPTRIYSCRSSSAQSAFDEPHLFLAVVTAGSRGDVVESVELVETELDLVSSDVLLDPGHPVGDRSDVVVLCEQPSQRDLCRHAPDLLGVGGGSPLH